MCGQRASVGLLFKVFLFLVLIVAAESGMAAPRNRTTRPAATQDTLLVNVSGAGTVTSNPGSVQCSSVCNESFVRGASVTLTATPATGYEFSGWAGGGCPASGTCTLIMSGSDSVMATFRLSGNAGGNPPPTPTPVTYALLVSVSGSGSVNSSPAGIACGGDCGENYASGTSVTLNAAPASGYAFSGWSGACSGTGNCMVSMTAARNATATFVANTPPPTTPPPSTTPTAHYLISWQAVADNRVSGYKLYYALVPFGSGGNVTTINLGNVTSYSFNPASAGLVRGATVYFAVAATGSGLESPMSDQTSINIE